MQTSFPSFPPTKIDSLISKAKFISSYYRAIKNSFPNYPPTKIDSLISKAKFISPYYWANRKSIYSFLYKVCGEGNSNPLQYSCLENPMNKGAWWTTVHMVTKSRTQLSLHTHTKFENMATKKIFLYVKIALKLYSN